MPNTIQIHRALRAAPEKVYRTLLDPDAMAKWLPLKSDVGGQFGGDLHSFGGTYTELVPTNGLIKEIASERRKARKRKFILTL
jgi:uncharacterized protein YndB with AHSA1/START domain